MLASCFPSCGYLCFNEVVSLLKRAFAYPSTVYGLRMGWTGTGLVLFCGMSSFVLMVRAGVCWGMYEAPGKTWGIVAVEEVLVVTCMVSSRYMDYKAYRDRYPTRTVSRKSRRCMVSTSTYLSYKAYTSTYPARTVRPTRWFVVSGRLRLYLPREQDYFLCKWLLRVFSSSPPTSFFRYYDDLFSHGLSIASHFVRVPTLIFSLFFRV